MENTMETKNLKIKASICSRQHTSEDAAKNVNCLKDEPSFVLVQSSIIHNSQDVESP